MFFTHFFLTRSLSVESPLIFSFTDDYWRGLYAFGFAVSNGSIREVVDQFLVVMDHNGGYLGYLNSSTHSFNYVNQLSETELYYFLRP